MIAKPLLVHVLGGWRGTVFAALVVLVGLFAGWQTLALHQVQNGYDQHLNDDARLAEKNKQLVAATEAGWRQGVYRAVFNLETTRLKREQETERTVGCLRDGTCRVRERFTCPAVPATPGSTGAADDAPAGGLQPADAEFLVRFAAECDAVVEERNLGRQYAETVTGKP